MTITRQLFPCELGRIGYEVMEREMENVGRSLAAFKGLTYRSYSWLVDIAFFVPRIRSYLLPLNQLFSTMADHLYARKNDALNVNREPYQPSVKTNSLTFHCS